MCSNAVYYCESSEIMQLQPSLPKRSSQSAKFELGTGWGDGSSSGSLTVTWVDTTGNFLFNLNTIEKGDFFHHFILCWLAATSLHMFKP